MLRLARCPELWARPSLSLLSWGPPYPLCFPWSAPSVLSLPLLSVLPSSLRPLLDYRWVPELTLWAEGAGGPRVETLEDWLGWETWRDQFTLLSVGAICPVSWTPTSCG